MIINKSILKQSNVLSMYILKSISILLILLYKCIHNTISIKKSKNTLNLIKRFFSFNFLNPKIYKK